MRVLLVVAMVLVAAGCDVERLLDDNSGRVAPPSSLQYTVEPSGTPGVPMGLVLRWNDDGDPDLAVWHVYSRASQNDNFGQIQAGDKIGQPHGNLRQTQKCGKDIGTDDDEKDHGRGFTRIQKALDKGLHTQFSF